MLRANYKGLIFLSAIITGIVACAGEDPSAGVESAITEPTVEPGAPRLLGTFRDEYAAAGIALLTLKSDWTYHKEEAVVCVRYPCDRPETNGHYRTMQREGESFLELVDDRGGVIEQYSYLMKGDSLYLSKDGEQAQTLVRSECAWCEMPKDCLLQSLAVGPCAGTWACEDSGCSYVCFGTTSPPKEPSSCPATPDPTE
jgi:hypothetical protein